MIVIIMNKTLQLTPSEIEELLTKIGRQYLVTPGPYMRYKLNKDGSIVNIYESGKVVFQGKELKDFTFKLTPAEYPQCGSDEVGTGDYFGPIVVCATLVTKDKVKKLQQLGVGDSKGINDQIIRKIAPELIELLPHSICLLTPEKYNEVCTLNNMNKIKARLHNQCYLNLEKKVGELPALKVIDQFTPEKQYYAYLNNEERVVTGIHFETKAENAYLCVGAGSIIARYAFLKTFDQYEELFHITFPKGAGAKVDQFGKQFLKDYGTKEFNKYAKLNFKNTEKIKE